MDNVPLTANIGLLCRHIIFTDEEMAEGDDAEEPLATPQIPEKQDAPQQQPPQELPPLQLQQQEPVQEQPQPQLLQ